MPDLERAGVKFIDFTGGEPTLANRFVTVVASSAKKHSMRTGMVTAAHWATSRAMTEKWIARFSDVDNWDISTDVHHTPFVPVENVQRAFEALAARGKEPLIRVAHSADITLEEARLIERVMSFAGKGIAFQSIGAVGRGADLVANPEVSPTAADQTPCPTTGPLVRSGGVVAPCCAPLSHRDSPHPLQLGNAFHEPLVEIVRRWRVHPLLQAIRLWGFKVVDLWLKSEGMDMTPAWRERTCMTCVSLLENREWAECAAEVAGRLENKVRIAHGLLETFDEPWMNEELKSEARDALMAGASAS